jgi:hypothetical protein
MLSKVGFGFEGHKNMKNIPPFFLDKVEDFFQM